MSIIHTTKMMIVKKKKAIEFYEQSIKEHRGLYGLEIKDNYIDYAQREIENLKIEIKDYENQIDNHRVFGDAT